MHCPCSNRIRQSWSARTVSRKVLNIPKDVQRIYKLPGQLISQTLLHDYPLVPSKLSKHNFLCHFPYCTNIQGSLHPISPYISPHIHWQRLVTSYLETQVSVPCSKKTLALQNIFMQHENTQWHHSGLIILQHSSDKKLRTKNNPTCCKAIFTAQGWGNLHRWEAELATASNTSKVCRVHAKMWLSWQSKAHSCPQAFWGMKCSVVLGWVWLHGRVLAWDRGRTMQ